jgi:hypothetical protein
MALRSVVTGSIFLSAFSIACCSTVAACHCFALFRSEFLREADQHFRLRGLVLQRYQGFH